MEALRTAGLPVTGSKTTELLTPLPGGTKDVSSPDDQDTQELKRKLAFEEEQKEETKDATKEAEPEKEITFEKPRSSRTSATKISPALLQKIENNVSGVELKITALIPFDGLSLLCDALSRNSSTERLDLEGCGVGDKGCVLIRDLLIGNKIIKHVDLQMNQITDVGCRYLSEILPKNLTLQKLYLGYNDIKDDGVYALIAAMRPRGQLEVVVSGNTNVSDQALGRLDRALEQQWKPVSGAVKQKKEVFGVDVNPYMDLFGSSSPRTKSDRKEKEKKIRAADDDEPLALALASSQPPQKRAKLAEGERGEGEERDGGERGGGKEREKEQGASAEVQSREKGEKARERAEKEKSERSKEAAQRKAAAKKAEKEKSTTRTSPGKGKEEVLAAAAATQEEEAASEEEECGADEELYTGMPFTFKFADSPNSSIWSEGSTASVGSDADAHCVQRKNLASRFNMQWRRLRVFAEDALIQDQRELALRPVLPAPQNLFSSACKFVARQQGFGHRQLLNPPKTSEPASLSERQRRKRVRQRVKALSLKLKHLVEDAAREQRCEAQMLAILHGTLLPSQGEVPAGYSAELGFVHVPCPFRLQVQVCGNNGEAPPINIV